MGHYNRPRIDKEDFKLFQAIGKHGFVDMPYIYRFLYLDNKKNTILGRIRQLRKYKYLQTLDTFIPPEWSMDLQTGYGIITLGTAGLRLMRNRGYDVLNNIHALKAAQPYRMYHQVQVATVCDALQEQYAKQNSKWEVYDILNERDAYIEGAGNQPDALIIFKSKLNEIYILVFLELERSYASERSVQRKLIGYENNILSKKFVNKLQLPVIRQRVLFVSQTEGQFHHILDKIENIDHDQKIEILVSTYQRVTNRGIEDMYVEPKTHRRCKLLQKELKA